MFYGSYRDRLKNKLNEYNKIPTQLKALLLIRFQQIRIRIQYFKKDPDPDFSFYVRYLTLLHLPPLRIRCLRGCWDRTQDCCDFGIDNQTL